MLRTAAYDYINIHDLDLRYGGACGIITTGGGSHLHFYDLDISYIGGSYITGTTRYGNGITWQNNTSHLICERNNISQCFDIGIDWEGDLAGQVINDIVVRNNHVSGCQVLFATKLSSADSTQSNIVVANNTWASAGGWSVAQNANFAVPYFARFHTSGTVSSYTYKNNIHANTDAASYYLVWGIPPATAGEYTFDHNLYYMASDDSKFRWNYTNYNFTNFEALSFVGDETWGDPLLTGYTISAGSPAINAGETIATITDDIDGTVRPQNGAYDIGAFEYIAPPTGTGTFGGGAFSGGGAMR